MQQVVLNLVLNGAQAMLPKGGGTLTVRSRLVDQRTNVELSVQDTGEGIAPENLAKIFDPFFTTKADGKGVGLGLAVLYGIVKAHDGEVEVSSQRNVGTTFTVTVPVKSRKDRFGNSGSAGADCVSALYLVAVGRCPGQGVAMDHKCSRGMVPFARQAIGRVANS